MVDTAAALILAGMFVLLSVGVLALGISVYNSANQASARNYSQRTALSYVANQIRLGDSRGGMEIRDLNGVSALALRSEIDGEAYVTLLYCYDGQLREMFTEDGLEQEPSSGVAIMPVREMGFAASGGSVHIAVTDAEGRREALVLTPRSGI
jgi:hypothetical protein